MKHSGPDNDARLKLLALIFIGLAAGPEVGIAMEMTTLLEILGAAAFFMAFEAGAKMLLLDLAASLRDFLRPPFVIAMRRPGAIVYMVTRTSWLAVVILVLARFCLELSTGRLTWMT